MDIGEIIENFEFLDQWEDRYRYLIELGGGLPAFDEAAMVPANKVSGCVSQVWIVAAPGDGPDPVIEFSGTSDAHIVRGLIAVAFAIFSGQHASAIVERDEKEIFARIGLDEHITPQRANGLNSLVARIKDHARAAL